jgi:O-methyltransferase involved in polyketide biosynthesis
VASGSGDKARTAVPAGKARTLEFDISVAHPARVRDYLLGGKDNYAADRAAADHVIEAAPFLVNLVRADRAFLASAVRYLAASLGIRQFLDIGTGLPAANNTHEVAQKAAPESRVVYVDFDPVVLAHARALLIGTPEGATAYVEADARDTGKILAAAEDTLDFSRPVAVLLLGILPFIPDEDDPWAITARLMDAVPPGSYLAVSHGAGDIRAEDVAEARSRYNKRTAVPLQLRTRAEFTRFLDGLELAGPGIVPVSHWQPAPPPDSQQEKEVLPAYAALGRKPATSR